MASFPISDEPLALVWLRQVQLDKHGMSHRLPAGDDGRDDGQKPGKVGDTKLKGSVSDTILADELNHQTHSGRSDQTRKR